MKVIGRVCWLCGLVLWLGLMGCRPEMPVTSTITIEGDGLTLPVNKELYGLMDGIFPLFPPILFPDGGH